MRRRAYERLSAQDNDFLRWETPALPVQGCVICIFDGASLTTLDGGIEFELIRRALEAAVHRRPRLRQKLMWGHSRDSAVWVHDPRFDIYYHVRHIRLPCPGTGAQLKELAAQVAEEPLDRAKPPWEIWVVKGLEDRRFALIVNGSPLHERRGLCHGAQARAFSFRAVPLHAGGVARMGATRCVSRRPIRKRVLWTARPSESERAGSE